MKKNEITDFLKHIELCMNFNRIELERFSSLCRLAKFSAKDLVFEEGDNENFINYFYIVLSGNVQISKKNNNNGMANNLLINILTGGDCFGEIAILREDKTRTATVKCLTATSFLLIDRRDFLEFYNANRIIADNLIKIFMNYLNHSNNVSRFVVFSSKDASIRLAYMLEFLKSKYLRSQVDNRIQIQLPFNSGKVAEFLCMKQQLYSRCKISLSRNGLAEISGKKIIILDYKKFQAFLTE